MGQGCHHLDNTYFTKNRKATVAGSRFVAQGFSLDKSPLQIVANVLSTSPEAVIIRLGLY